METRVEYIETDNTRLEIAACRMAASLFAEGERVYLLCASQAAAVELDGLLWTFDDQSFIPHSLWSGEEGFTDPVAVGWLGTENPNGAGVLLVASIGQEFDLAGTAGLFGRVVDFVPTAEGPKKRAARERYKAMGAAGFSPLFRPLAG